MGNQNSQYHQFNDTKPDNYTLNETNRREKDPNVKEKDVKTNKFEEIPIKSTQELPLILIKKRTGSIALISLKIKFMKNIEEVVEEIVKLV